MDKRKHRIYRQSVLWFMAMIILISGCHFQNQNDEYDAAAVKGFSDLTKIDFNQKLVNLNGEWEFYWQQLLSPEDFQVKEKLNPQYLNVPSNWARISGEQHLSQDGYATYRIKILLKDTDKVYGLKLYKIYTSYNLWIDGELAAKQGMVAENRHLADGKLSSDIVFFQPAKESVEIILQVSSYDYYRSGLVNKVEIGSQEQILENKHSRLAFEIFVSGIIFMMALYHIILYFIWSKELSSIFFGFFSFLVFLQTLIDGELVINYIFFGIDFQKREIFQNIVIFMMIPTFLNFLYYLFNRTISRFILKFAYITSFAAALLIIILPFQYLTTIWHFYILFILFFGIYALYFFIKRIIQHKPHSIILLFGYIVVYFSGLYDLLGEHGFVRFLNLFPIGMLIFLLVQTFILADNFSKAFFKIEILSKELQQKNLHLQRAYKEVEKEVEERTKALKESEEKYHHLADATFEGIVIHDKQAVLEVNMNMAKMVGYEVHEVIGKSILDFFPEEEHEKVIDQVKKFDRSRYETQLIKKSGNLLQVEILSREFVYKGKTARVAAIRDISQWKKVEEDLREAKKELEKANMDLRMEKQHLERLAVTDELTDIHNHRYIVQKLEEEMGRSRRYQKDLAIIMIDIDHFKKVNDTYGHQTGDEVLRKVSQTMKHHLREIDFIGRYGGEEFLIILPETGLDDAYWVAERIRQQIEMLEFKHSGLNVTISGGVAQFNHQESDLELLIRADTLLYKAKGDGRNRIEK